MYIFLYRDLYISFFVVVFFLYEKKRFESLWILIFINLFKEYIFKLKYCVFCIKKK